MRCSTIKNKTVYLENVIFIKERYIDSGCQLSPKFGMLIDHFFRNFSLSILLNNLTNQFTVATFMEITDTSAELFFIIFQFNY